MRDGGEDGSSWELERERREGESETEMEEGKGSREIDRVGGWGLSTGVGRLGGKCGVIRKITPLLQGISRK